MGTYTTQDFMDTFGGMPEPGEAAVDPDELVDALDAWDCTPDAVSAAAAARLRAAGWTPVGDPALPSRSLPPCGGPCGPEGCMARGCPVAR